MQRTPRRRFLSEIAATTVTVGFGLGCHASTRRRTDDVREVSRFVPARYTLEGAGVRLRRALGSAALPLLDPFLLLDEIHSDRREDWIAGFPTHPHRGFETVSYLVRGAFEHRDSVGNHGVLSAGACQWMTAGRGIVHSEMPQAEPGQDLWGLQLWVNLPAAKKMMRPRYQDMQASTIPEIDVADARVRVAAGRIGRTRGPIDGIDVGPTLLDVSLPAGAVFRHGVAARDASFAYVLDGEARFGARATPIADGELAILEGGREVVASSDAGARFLLLAARPIGEPVARRGPFVMNTEAELDQAVADYRSGRLAGG